MKTMHASLSASTLQRMLFEMSRYLLAMLSVALIAMAVTGCAKREKVIEVDTPGGSVDVERVTHPDGDVDLKIENRTP